MDKHSAPAQGRIRLTRQKVLDAALRLVDSDGADALTKRRLGQALDCDPSGASRSHTRTSSRSSSPGRSPRRSGSAP